MAFCSGPAAGICAQIRSSPTANPQVSATRLLRIRNASLIAGAEIIIDGGKPAVM
jgi:hypothetical protein